ncbi:hypothetical protein GW17_00026798 [Ensete ventricosum]|nr:hypothetical protein GW17_00026798 [Ensete ventricosum]
MLSRDGVRLSSIACRSLMTSFAWPAPFRSPVSRTCEMKPVGETFVNRYYHFLRNSPELVHRFYQESSRLGRADDHGNVTSVTTIDVGA